MKKISKLLMLAVLALGVSFSACNNDDIPQGGDQKEGNTHVSVSLKLSMDSFRSSVENNDEDFNYVGEWAGADLINSISVYLIDPAASGPVARKYYEVGDGKPYKYSTENNIVKIVPRNTEAAIQTIAGDKTVYVVVNETEEIKTLLTSTSVNTFRAAYEGIAELENSGLDFTKSETSASNLAEVSDNKDVIVMTNLEPANITVQEGVDADAAIVEGNSNQANLNVERAVARVLVTIAEKDEFDVTDIGTITDVKWVLAQGENSLFIQRKVDWATPNFAWVPGEGSDDFYAQAGDKYDYSGLYEGYTAAPGFGGAVLTSPNASNGNKNDENAGNIGGKSVGAGKFILPTTHQYASGDASGYKKGNTAYVMIRAKFTPAKFADEGTAATDGTFYVGANGKFYTSAAAAVNSATGGVEGQTVAKYVGGKVLYYAWVNPDNVDTKKWYNSPVLRNNIYHIHITGFGSLGTNWNPLFPEDPNVEPYTPNEEYKPGEPTTPGTNEPFDPTKPNDKFDPDKPVGPDNNPFLPNEEYDPELPTTPGTNPPYIPNEEYEPKNPDPKPWVPGVDEPTNPIDPEDPLTTPETWMSVKVNVLPWKVHSYEIEF